MKPYFYDINDEVQEGYCQVSGFSQEQIVEMNKKVSLFLEADCGDITAAIDEVSGEYMHEGDR